MACIGISWLRMKSIVSLWQECKYFGSVKTWNDAKVISKKQNVFSSHSNSLQYFLTCSESYWF
jgi:hypothetical protein